MLGYLHSWKQDQDTPQRCNVCCDVPMIILSGGTPTVTLTCWTPDGLPILAPLVLLLTRDELSRSIAVLPDQMRHISSCLDTSTGDTPTAPNTLPAKEMEGVLEFRTCSKLLEDHGFCPHLDLSGRSSAECCCELSHILSGPDSRSPSPPEGIGCTRSPAVMDWDGHPRASLAVG